jgi:hypothetical protein
MNATLSSTVLTTITRIGHEPIFQARLNKASVVYLVWCDQRHQAAHQQQHSQRRVHPGRTRDVETTHCGATLICASGGGSYRGNTVAGLACRLG